MCRLPEVGANCRTTLAEVYGPTYAAFRYGTMAAVAVALCFAGWKNAQLRYDSPPLPRFVLRACLFALTLFAVKAIDPLGYSSIEMNNVMVLTSDPITALVLGAAVQIGAFHVAVLRASPHQPLHRTTPVRLATVFSLLLFAFVELCSVLKLADSKPTFAVVQYSGIAAATLFTTLLINVSGWRLFVHSRAALRALATAGRPADASLRRNVANVACTLVAMNLLVCAVLPFFLYLLVQHAISAPHTAVASPRRFLLDAGLCTVQLAAIVALLASQCWRAPPAQGKPPSAGALVAGPGALPASPEHALGTYVGSSFVTLGGGGDDAAAAAPGGGPQRGGGERGGEDPEAALGCRLPPRAGLAGAEHAPLLQVAAAGALLSGPVPVQRRGVHTASTASSSFPVSYGSRLGFDTEDEDCGGALSAAMCAMYSPPDPGLRGPAV